MTDFRGGGGDVRSARGCGSVDAVRRGVIPFQNVVELSLATRKASKRPLAGGGL